MPCFPAQLQAPAKSFLRPSTWMPGSKNYHVRTERWKLEADPEQCIDEIMNAVERLNETEHPHEYFTNKVRHQDHWIQIFAYTPAGWLDIMEISILPFGNNTSIAKISSFSTGMLPAWVPFGFICDMILCWCPFSDGGMNEFRCELLRESLPFHVSVMDETESDKLLSNEHNGSAMQYSAPETLRAKETPKNK